MKRTMKPENMHQMLETVMSKMFFDMPVEHGIQFVTTMMPKCLTMAFAEISP